MKPITIVVIVGILFFSILFHSQSFAESYPDLGVKVETVAKNLSIPWSIDFAYDGRIFFSERTGTLQVIDKGIQKQIMALDVGGGEGGMLGIALDPDFESNHYIYVYYTYNELISTKNKLVRYVESNNSLTDEKTLLDDIPGASYHDGGRIKFGPDGKLYITTGDSGDPNLSQRLDSVAGKILRINSDGSIPDDNPFPDSAVYSYGHRNPQGIDWDKSGVLIGTEHGPSGERGVAHDEINLIQAGQNYGWPVLIGDETKDGMTSPVLHSGDDTWAPSGSAFYYGEIPQWDGLYFAASLRGEHLLAIEFDSEYNVISYEKLFLGEYGRLRDVVNGPDGLYVLTSNQDGRGSPTENDDRILRITPLYDTVPKWVENILVWFEEGKISEQEMRNAIEWLMSQGILKDDFLEESTSQNCSGIARCITGSVTKIIDGDTIHVDGQSIRFALASAPELSGYEGVESREFIQTICPVGSDVMVDEDDGQTSGSYGRIIGVIYCNEVNLNSELLDANLGYMEYRFCDSSEFGDSDWAQKHGC